MGHTILIILMHLIIIPLIPKGIAFTMKMIPIDSSNLQILPQNLSAYERSKYLIDVSLSRAQVFQTKNSTLSPNSVKGTVYGVENGFYVTPVNIGEGAGALSTYLLLDTTSEQTWVQCEGCRPCINSTGRNFDYKQSPKFKKVAPEDTLCLMKSSPYEGSCGFEAPYAGGKAVGFLGRDTFYFENSQTGNQEAYQSLTFGCVQKSQGFGSDPNKGPQNGIPGVYGLASGKSAFINQLQARIQNRFSYCLPPWYTEITSQASISFGGDAQIQGDDSQMVQKIPLIVRKSYYLTVTAISVDGDKLPIEDISIFEYNSSSTTQGFMIDSGAPYTILTKSAYDLLRDAVSNYFRDNYRLNPTPPPTKNDAGFQLCYKVNATDELDFPKVIFHFAGVDGSGEVDMVMSKGNMFQTFEEKGEFCLMVLSTETEPSMSLFGAFQQTNFQILFDISNGLFQFVTKRCQGMSTV